MRRLKKISITLFTISLVLIGFNIYRNKTIVDQTGPVFNMESDQIIVSVKDGEEALKKGMTAVDAKDGDVTDSIIVEAISPFTGTGHRIVSYAAFDSDNHVTHEKRELIYTDYVASRFHLSKPLSFAMNATNLLSGITVEDCIDGDLTKNVKMISDGEIDTTHVGEYDAKLKVMNSAGGVSYLPVTIEIYDASVQYRLPQLRLRENVVYIEKGASFDPEEYLESISINGKDYSLTDEKGTYGNAYVSEDETDTIGIDRVEVEGNVDTDVSGYYEIIYSFEDTQYSTGTGKVRLYVVVSEEGAA